MRERPWQHPRSLTISHLASQYVAVLEGCIFCSFPFPLLFTFSCAPSLPLIFVFHCLFSSHWQCTNFQRTRSGSAGIDWNSTGRVRWGEGKASFSRILSPSQRHSSLSPILVRSHISHFLFGHFTHSENSVADPRALKCS